MAEGLVDFYRREGISPVRQRIEDLDAHFGRREALYRQLGIPPRAIEGKQVLEIGPGSGYNSLYTAYLKPERYVLVEGNETGIEEINRLFSEFPALHSRLEIHHCFFEQFGEYEKFDFVFCEGILGQIPEPAGSLRLWGRFVRAGGVLAVTTVDHISVLADMLRRLFAHLYVSPKEPLARRVEVLLPIFTPQLSALKGMTRRHDDWIMDNLLVPTEIAKFFSFADSIAALAEDFEFYSSSPHFVQDWRWYKKILPEVRNYNELALGSYWENVHSFINFDETFSSRPAPLNRALLDSCDELVALIRAFERTEDLALLPEIVNILRTKVIDNVRSFSSKTAEALSDVCGLVELKREGAEQFKRSEAFGSFWGRGQQYLTLTKKLKTA